MRRAALDRFLELAEQIHARDVPPMTEDEMMAEVGAVRAECRRA